MFVNTITPERVQIQPRALKPGGFIFKSSVAIGIQTSISIFKVCCHEGLRDAFSQNLHF